MQSAARYHERGKNTMQLARALASAILSTLSFLITLPSRSHDDNLHKIAERLPPFAGSARTELRSSARLAAAPIDSRGRTVSCLQDDCVGRKLQSNNSTDKRAGRCPRKGGNQFIGRKKPERKEIRRIVSVACSTGLWSGFRSPLLSGPKVAGAERRGGAP